MYMGLTYEEDYFERGLHMKKMMAHRIFLRSFYFVLILTGLVFLSCEEEIGGLVLDNKAPAAYRFTGNYSGYVDFANSFDVEIQPGKSFTYDNADDTIYGNFQVHVYDLSNRYEKLKSTTVSIPKPSTRESVSLSWDGTSFR
jgi:hypothetical protein